MKPATVAAKLAAQAKALAALWFTLLAQVYAVIGDGGLDAVQQITFGKWLSIVLWTANAYGVVYALPNIQAAVSGRPSTSGGPIGFSPTNKGA